MKFVDDKIVHFESDVAKIQATPAQYISYLRDRGALHLTKEIIDNMTDECVNPNSPAKHIRTYLDENENTFTCSDDGRGIPFDKMELVSTTIQSGSKFQRDNVGKTAGQNGVGLCAVNAMSEKYSIISTRYGERKVINFENGIKVNEKIEKVKDKNEHGTTFVFKPSEFYLNGKCPIKSAELLKWVEKIMYLMPSDVSLTMGIKKKGKETEVIKEFKNEHGLLDYVNKLSPNPTVAPVHLMGDCRIVEFDKGKELERFLGVEVAFTYDRKMDAITDSFCNFVNTTDGGEHVIAVQSAISTFLVKATKEALSESEAKKLDVSVKDTVDNLVLTLYVSTDCHPQFTGQTKEKVGNKDLREPIKKIITDAIEKYFMKNPKVLNKYTAIVKENAKLRAKIATDRKAIIKQDTGALSDHKIRKLIPCNNRGKEYKELFIVEGDSASGNIESMRDDKTQAAFLMKGVPLNTWGKSLVSILANEEMNELVRALRTNFGVKFDISKLYYDKIIILTDSDIDGSRICSLLCLFFVLYMPDIIREGRLYRALPPLYKVNMDGKELFVRSKAEFVNITEKKISKVCTISLNGKKLSSKDVTALLMNNRGYIEEVDQIADKIPLHPDIVEVVSRFYPNGQLEKNYKKYVPEMSYHDGVLEGVHEMSKWNVVVDDILYSQLKKVNKFVHDVNKDVMEYDISINKTGTTTHMTLYQLLTFIHKKFEPKINKRFKGLGEMSDIDLWETTLNPDNRTLLKFTMDDAALEADKFRMLHGPESEPRKMLLDGFKINKDDLDN